MKLFEKYGSKIRNFGNSNIVSNSFPYFFGTFGNGNSNIVFNSFTYFFRIFRNRKIQKSEISYLVSTSEKIESDFGSSEFLNTPKQ